MSSLQQYIHFQYDDAHQLLISTWNTTADMTDEEYRQVAIEYLKACEKYRPKYSLVDGRNAAYIIPLDIQEWLNGYIYPKCIDAGICKLAFLVVKDIYPNQFGVCGLCHSTSTATHYTATAIFS
jgi:hypothetical protein